MLEEIFKLKEKLEEKFPNWDFKWKVSGQRLLGLCPFHREEHHSFNIYMFSGRAYYRCFACGARGGIKEFSSGTPTGIKKYMKLFHDELMNNTTALEYFQRRGVSRKILREIENIGVIPKGFSNRNFHILSKSQGWIVFLYTNIHGEPLFFKLRKPYEKKIVIEKISEKEGEFAGFGFERILSGNENFIFFVEGEFDALVPMSKEGIILPIVAVGGTSGIMKVGKIAEDLIGLGKIPVVFPDNDEAGLLAASKISSEKVSVAIGLETKDLGEECLEKSFKEVLKKVSIKTPAEVGRDIEKRKLEKIIKSKLPDSLKKAAQISGIVPGRITNKKEERIIVKKTEDFANTVKAYKDKKCLLVGFGEIEGDYFHGVPKIEELSSLLTVYDVIFVNPAFLLGDEKEIIRNLFSIVSNGKVVILFK